TRELLAHGRRGGLPVAPLEIGKDALEGLARRAAAAGCPTRGSARRSGSAPPVPESGAAPATDATCATCAAGAAGSPSRKRNRHRAASVEHDRARLRRELLPRRLYVESVVSCERLDQLEKVHVAPVPAADGAACERERRMRDDALGIEELLDAETAALRARAGWIVEREKLGLERRNGVPA